MLLSKLSVSVFVPVTDVMFVPPNILKVSFGVVAVVNAPVSSPIVTKLFCNVGVGAPTINLK